MEEVYISNLNAAGRAAAKGSVAQTQASGNNYALSEERMMDAQGILGKGNVYIKAWNDPDKAPGFWSSVLDNLLVPGSIRRSSMIMQSDMRGGASMLSFIEYLLNESNPEWDPIPEVKAAIIPEVNGYVGEDRVRGLPLLIVPCSDDQKAWKPLNGPISNNVMIWPNLYMGCDVIFLTEVPELPESIDWFTGIVLGADCKGIAEDAKAGDVFVNNMYAFNGGGYNIPFAKCYSFAEKVEAYSKFPNNRILPPFGNESETYPCYIGDRIWLEEAEWGEDYPSPDYPYYVLLTDEQTFTKTEDGDSKTTVYPKGSFLWVEGNSEEYDPVVVPFDAFFKWR